MRTNKKSILFCAVMILMLSVKMACAGGSCPWVYVWDGEKWDRLTIEIALTAGKAMDFSPTLFALPDKTKKVQKASIGELYFYREEDYLKFDHQKPINNSYYRIKLEQQPYANGLENQLLLEHFVADLFELSIIDHPNGSVVFIGQNQEVFVVDPAYWHKPISALGSDGNDYKKQLSVSDSMQKYPEQTWYVFNDPTRIPEYLTRVWDGVEGSTDYKKEEYINNKEIYKKALEQIETRGNYLTLDFGDLSNIPPEQPLRLLLSSFFAGSLSAKSFYTKDVSGKWVLRSRELMAENKYHGIDISDWIVDRKKVQIRIMTKADIDWAVIDASPDIKYSLYKLSPKNAITEEGADITKELRSKDGKTYEFWAGQKIYIDFDYVPIQKNLLRSFVLKSIGQSQFYMNGDFDKVYVEYLNSRAEVTIKPDTKEITKQMAGETQYQPNLQISK